MKAGHPLAALALGLLLAPMLALPAPAATSASSPDPDQASVSFSTDPTELLASFREINGELAAEDTSPTVEIYGDGTVRVHRPGYFRYPGDYEMRLDDAGLARLLLQLADAVTAFDRSAVRYQKYETETARHTQALAEGRSPVLYQVEDDSITLLELNLDGYRPAGGSRTTGEIHRTIRWPGLRTDVARFPQIEPLRNLLAAEEALRALAEHDDLRRTSR